MIVIGLTGGFASGKTTIAQMFAEYEGVAMLNCDEIAKTLTQYNTPAYKAISFYFGHDFLLPNKDINRSLLRERIFKHPQEKQWLEQLLHPLISGEIKHQLSEIQALYTIIEIPLLAESEKKRSLNYLTHRLVIDMPLELQIKRACDRNHLSREEVLHIIQLQASREDRLAIADDVIENTGSLEELSEKVKALHEKYKMLNH